MANSQSPSTATAEEHSIGETSSSPKPNLASLPSTFVLATNLSESELHEIEDSLVQRGAPLTYNIKEANLVIGNISKWRRAKFELKRRKVLLEDDEHSPKPGVMPGSPEKELSSMVVKRRKLKSGVLDISENLATVNSEKDGNAEKVTMKDDPIESSRIARSTSQVSLVEMSSMSESSICI